MKLRIEGFDLVLSGFTWQAYENGELIAQISYDHARNRYVRPSDGMGLDENFAPAVRRLRKIVDAEADRARVADMLGGDAHEEDRM